MPVALRATSATGLYPHQQWLLATRPTSGPSLQTGFPTYGKLQRQLGYQTPYFGKRHLSNPPANGSTVGYLEDYGFRGMTNPDLVGTNGQGADDDIPVIADSAAKWLRTKAGHAEPFCLTVSFVNPHDKESVWAGSEAPTYNNLFNSQSLKPFNPDYMVVPSEENPPPLRFSTIPPNWERSADLPEHGNGACQAR